MSGFDARRDGVVTDAGFIAINPGTGPVQDADERAARANIDALIRDAEFDPVEVTVTRGRDEDDGRYAYELELDGRRAEVDMPGLPLDRVRYLNRPDQNIWDFPRLYVDGSSWVWLYAVNRVRAALLPPEDEADENPAYDQWTPYDERGVGE